MLPLEISSTGQAIIFMGIQASGKSTFYQRHLSSTHAHVNRDTLKTRHREEVLVESCLNEGRSFVVDDTNLTKGIRAGFISAALNAGFQVIGVFFRSVVADSVRRNALRESDARVPSHAIAASSNRLELPSMEEGFHELWYAYIENDEFKISEWRAE